MSQLAAVRDVLATIADRLAVEVPGTERPETSVSVPTISPTATTPNTGSTTATAGNRVSVLRWSGHEAHALQRALRLTNEGFAHLLGVAVRTVANWHACPQMVLSNQLQQVCDITLDRAPIEAHHRFAAMTAPMAVAA